MSRGREIDYADLESLVVEREFDDTGDLHVVFECPVSGQRFEGEGWIDREHDLQTRVRSSFLRDFGYRIASWIGDLTEMLTGSRLLEGLADSLAYEASELAEEQSGLAYSEEAVREGVVNAFEDVRNDFMWDESAGRWIANT